MYTTYAPGLRLAAALAPRGLGLRRGYRVQRAMMGLGRLGAGRDVEVVTVAPGVSARVQRPDGLAGELPVLVWIHGGGRVLGTAAQDDRYLRGLARELGCATVAIEHRLAPEHPHPGPLEDCHRVLEWVVDQPWVDPARVAIGGASAGGGFAASLARLARDRGTVRPVLQALAYPMLDDSTGRERQRPQLRLWSGRDNEQAWQWYAGAAERDASLSPARCRDLAGLAPAWIGVGTHDLFLDECRVYADRLRAAGVAVTLHESVGAFHAFDQLAPRAPVSRAFRAGLVTALAGAFDPHRQGRA